MRRPDQGRVGPGRALSGQRAGALPAQVVLSAAFPLLTVCQPWHRSPRGRVETKLVPARHSHSVDGLQCATRDGVSPSGFREREFARPLAARGPIRALIIRAAVRRACGAGRCDPLDVEDQRLHGGGSRRIDYAWGFLVRLQHRHPRLSTGTTRWEYTRECLMVARKRRHMALWLG
jgi:hypothetical protein